MAERSTAGVVLTVLGVGLLAASFLPHSFGWLPLATSALLLLVGGTLVAANLRRAAPTLAIPPAHVTFYQQTKRDLPLPDPPQGASSAETSSALEPMTAHDLELSLLEVQIREVNRKINKATVMLGTGKLSDEGYKRYVEDLKEERADLEAKRVRIEMSRA